MTKNFFSVKIERCEQTFVRTESEIKSEKEGRVCVCSLNSLLVALQRLQAQRAK
jgi:hypothetical protein